MMMLQFENAKAGLKVVGRSSGTSRSLEVFPLATTELFFITPPYIQSFGIIKERKREEFFSSTLFM